MNEPPSSIGGSSTCLKCVKSGLVTQAMCWMSALSDDLTVVTAEIRWIWSGLGWKKINPFCRVGLAVRVDHLSIVVPSSLRCAEARGQGIVHTLSLSKMKFCKKASVCLMLRHIRPPVVATNGGLFQNSILDRRDIRCRLQAARPGSNCGGVCLPQGQDEKLPVTPQSRAKDVVNWFAKAIKKDV